MEANPVTPQDLVAKLEDFIKSGVEKANGETKPIKPGHRYPFHWPPHAISHDYHVDAASFNEIHTVGHRGVNLTCKIARTPFGIFGRVEDIWNEAKAETVEKVLEELVAGTNPWFDRFDDITNCLGRTERFTGSIAELPYHELIFLLYCPNRDVAHQALVEIEKQASTGLFAPALIRILDDDKHPHRRIAHWCALDLFEDVAAFAPQEEDQSHVIRAIKDLIWRAEDDYARAIFKAGVVLGGHICSHESADALLSCFKAPSRIGRRSAIHASFHLAEWLPSRKNDIINRLNEVSRSDSDAALRQFAECMARDVRSGAVEHVDEPIFPDEIS